MELERLVVGADFNPEVGFLRREDFARSLGAFRFSPRPRSIDAIRRFVWEARFDTYDSRSRAGRLDTELLQGQFAMEFENSDRLQVDYIRSNEYVDRPYDVAGVAGLRVAAGGYRFQDVQVGYQLGQQRRFSGEVTAQHGGFFGGTKTTIGFGRRQGFSGGRLEITPRISFEPGLQLNWIDIPAGDVMATLVTTRTTVTFTPFLFASAAGPVQLRRQQRQRQRAAALGVPAGQRAVHRLQRAARYAGAGASRCWRIVHSS